MTSTGRIYQYLHNYLHNHYMQYPSDSLIQDYLSIHRVLLDIYKKQKLHLNFSTNLKRVSGAIFGGVTDLISDLFLGGELLCDESLIFNITLDLF